MRAWTASGIIYSDDGRQIVELNKTVVPDDIWDSGRVESMRSRCDERLR